MNLLQEAEDMDEEMVDNLVYVVSILTPRERTRLAEVLNMPLDFLNECVDSWKKERVQ
jgi:hypothetical protein